MDLARAFQPRMIRTRKRRSLSRMLPSIRTCDALTERSRAGTMASGPRTLGGGGLQDISLPPPQGRARRGNVACVRRGAPKYLCPSSAQQQQQQLQHFGRFLARARAQGMAQPTHRSVTPIRAPDYARRSQTRQLFCQKRDSTASRASTAGAQEGSAFALVSSALSLLSPWREASMMHMHVPSLYTAITPRPR
ncbi:hypothetical protein BS50DRAFT_74264 [Corynespora cassiicola Philippines]|uniref:Uncharacterized protein n=1 Tax=Corynespora cassiicola Philippines TaxID=1448308 RepID=A0A2T2NG94_CORCC|nr:hypothetical protein BS50DRAFT_74264 [Corynespora cassiicola Philippines]